MYCDAVKIGMPSNLRELGTNFPGTESGIRMPLRRCWCRRLPAYRLASIMRFSFDSVRPLRRARLPIAAVAARNSAAAAARDASFDNRPISIATLMRTTHFCSSGRASKRAATSELTGIARGEAVFMMEVYAFSPARQVGQRKSPVPSSPEVLPHEASFPFSGHE